MSWARVSARRRKRAEEILTEKQLEVLRMRMDGLSFLQIAAKLDRDEATCRGHYRRAIDKLRRDELARRSRQRKEAA